MFDYEEIKNSLFKYLCNNKFEGYDPYDFLDMPILKKMPYCKKMYPYFTFINKVSPINLRRSVGIPTKKMSKSMGLLLLGGISDFKSESNQYINHIVDWLIINKSKMYTEYSIGFNYNVSLQAYTSDKDEPSLFITLIVLFGLIEYYLIRNDEKIKQIIFSFESLLEREVYKCDDNNILWYSYTFNDKMQIHNITAVIGKYYSYLYAISKNENYKIKIKKILHYLQSVQREDGSWPYSKTREFSDGFHTIFILEAIWHMKKIVIDDMIINCYEKGLKNFKDYLICENGMPLHYHPKYKIDIFHQLMIKTDIRDCAVAIIYFTEIGEINIAKKVLDWALKNMYKNHVFNFFYSKWVVNNIAYIRAQAWMFYAISIFLKGNNEKN